MFIHDSRIFSFGLQDTVLTLDCVISVRQRLGISRDTVVAHRCLSLKLKLGLILEIQCIVKEGNRLWFHTELGL